MKPTLVADIGNSRIKWGRCRDGRVDVAVSLTADEPASWQSQLESWGIAGVHVWALSGVHPRNRDRLADWLRERHDRVEVIDSARQLPLRVVLEHPDRVGIDRLLNAVAAQTRRRPGTPAVLVDAGSAVTVDWLDESGAFCGGSIFPGLRLMAQALHDQTALLPLVKMDKTSPPVPGRSTVADIEAGVYWAAVGGIKTLIDQLKTHTTKDPQVFFTGGDAPLLAGSLDPTVETWPNMTLEGLRLAAESLP
jgi:type III pantothenate kinase